MRVNPFVVDNPMNVGEKGNGKMHGQTEAVFVEQLIQNEQLSREDARLHSFRPTTLPVPDESRIPQSDAPAVNKYRLARTGGKKRRDTAKEAMAKGAAKFQSMKTKIEQEENSKNGKAPGSMGWGKRGGSVQFEQDQPVGLDDSDSSDEDRKKGKRSRPRTQPQGRSLRSVAVLAASLKSSKKPEKKKAESRLQDGLAALGALPKLRAGRNDKKAVVLKAGGSGPDFRDKTTLAEVSRAQARATWSPLVSRSSVSGSMKQSGQIYRSASDNQLHQTR
jgi:hypothetical protein